MRRKQGFTLIELLVVIAIIGILAAMVFPVFARARESARKAVCLSNVKNLALAFQMYFIDYDAFPPRETSAEVNQFFEDQGCDVTPGCCTYPTDTNPYLRWPVVLDEYVRNRDVWRCPSARMPAVAGHAYNGPNWFAELQANWPSCVCVEMWPPGWDGENIDTITLVDGCPPDAATPGDGAVEFGYGDMHAVYGQVGLKLASIDDPVKYLILAEQGIKRYFDRVEQVAYPEVCRITWGAVVDRGCGTDCQDPVDQGCGIWYEDIDNFWGDASWRSEFTRHLGGNNLGFADGHAAWWSAGAILAAANANPSELPPLGPQDLPDYMEE
jgi:prepilin-type N-terminal cleavage/methylation domain-containing protein/prepilin-type processing-associated H-X9-DG protein